ncbi:MAG: phytoene/squalene synthase family protein [Planctomycetota bacterium]
MIASPHHPSPHQQLFGAVDPEDVLRRCGRTFYAAAKVLPATTRRELALLYAMCRAIDDSADATDAGEADDLLQQISDGLDGRDIGSPLVSAFRELAGRHDVPLVLVQQLIDGVRADLGEVRIKSLDELLRYSYRVASTVGLMMCRILRVPTEGDPFAIDLGIGMQLTNIARDVMEDAASGRVYLPGDWVPSETVLAAANEQNHTEVCAAIARLLDVADQYYESAELGMQFLPVAVRGGIRAAAWNYRAIGSVIRRDIEQSLADRARTSGAGKAVRTGLALWASVLESLPLGPTDPHNEELHGAVRALRLAAT